MMIQETYYLKPLVIETVDILNADFESWNGQTLNDWQISGRVVQTSGHTGHGAILYQNASISQTCKITGGHEYELSAWLRGVRYVANFEVSVSFDHGAGHQFDGIVENSWSQSKWRFTVPEDATEVTFLFAVPYQESMLDDVSCVLVE